MDSDNVWDSNERDKQVKVCMDLAKVCDSDERFKQKSGVATHFVDSAKVCDSDERDIQKSGVATHFVDSAKVCGRERTDITEFPVEPGKLGDLNFICPNPEIPWNLS